MKVLNEVKVGGWHCHDVKPSNLVRAVDDPVAGEVREDRIIVVAWSWRQTADGSPSTSRTS